CMSSGRTFNPNATASIPVPSHSPRDSGPALRGRVMTCAVSRLDPWPGRPTLSTKRAVLDDDLVQGPLENGELLIIELRDEQFRDAAQVDRSGLGQARHAGVGQCDDDGARVPIGVR